uniref:Helicase ATP-binding domain-containing protein n=1 Tax=Ditylenchus dipsaci TaxID=166011 RepID=A0A915D5V8_9BILA
MDSINVQENSPMNGTHRNGNSNGIRDYPTDRFIHEVKMEVTEEDFLEHENEEEDLFSYEKGPRVQIQQIFENQDNCTHEAAHPKDREIEPLIGRDEETSNKPKRFSFQPDFFQARACKCIDYNQSVLVSAHTSAGKTSAALYAIATALQKEEFPNVGLITGDNNINGDASCVVMTTEILRNKLYAENDTMKNVGWVIFDEVHYMSDKERGVVWEEAIILMPDEVRYVFLSATIPNARQFAEWVCYLHNQPCHVVTTHSRPVPLQHFLYPAGGDGLYQVVDNMGQFRQGDFNAAMEFLAKPTKNDEDKKKKKENVASLDVVKIIRTIAERDLLPCIAFSFSRKECEANATALIEMDFNNEKEKQL